MEHFRKETWYPRLFTRKIYENWVGDGSKTLFQRSNERVIDILENHEPDPLPKDVQQKMKDIIQRAENKLEL